jgi:hypothetical protein
MSINAITGTDCGVANAECPWKKAASTFVQAMKQSTQAAQTAPATRAELTPRQKELKAVVNELVGSVFFGEVFKSVRESKLKGEYGHGGRGEEIFSAQLHDVLAKKMGRSTQLGLNDAIYRYFEKTL